ncbi:hypothetical protein [Nocardia sp. BMG51109]|nr:hypothetical protein [Nocardia sp. BMG51109]
MTRSQAAVHHLASAPVVVGVDGSAADTALDWAADHRTDFDIGELRPTTP